MKKATKLFLVSCALFAVNKISALQTEIINISTGYDNIANAMTMYGNMDDMWMVKAPGATSFQNAYVYNHYAIPSCSRWVIPQALYVTGGNGIFRMNFNNTHCNIVSAKIVFTYTTSDDELLNFNVNSSMFIHPYITPKPGLFTGYINSPYTVTIPGGSILSGNNTIDFEVKNFADELNPETPFALALCAQLEITYDDVLAPSFFTNPTVCFGSQIPVNAATSTGIYGSHYWEIIESDQFGNVPVGATPYFNWFPGAPNAYYSFPAAAINAGCNKYYKIKLAGLSPCGTNWTETSQVIFVNCAPTVNIGPDQSICEGSCITLNSGGPIKKHTYVWSILGDEPVVIGSGGSITVCPTNTTTYCVTSTQSGTGCTATDCITITVLKTKPNFTLASNINPGDNYFTTLATPVNNAATVASIPGFGYAWIVEEIVGTSNPTVISGSMVSNSSCWWNPTLTTNFNGYDGPYFTSTSNTGNPMHLGCSNPNPGRFTAGHTYRITRGTWSTSCPWSQYSVIVYLGHAMVGSGAVVVQEDPNAPDYSYLMPAAEVTAIGSEENIFTVYPNPSDGMVNINYSIKKNMTAQLVITDLLGQVVKTIAVPSSQANVAIDMNAYKNGIYFISLFDGDHLIKSQKVILSH